MRCAVPMDQTQAFSRHFGKSSGLVLYEVDTKAKSFERVQALTRPDAGCDSLPGWLRELGVETVLVAGIGAGALNRLAEAGVRVVGGFDQDDPDQVAAAFANDPEAATAPGPCGEHSHDHKHCKH